MLKMGLTAHTMSTKGDALLKLPDNLRHHISIAWHFAWSDTRARYKRSVLGPFWLVLGTLIGVAGLGAIWGTLMQVKRADFVPSLTVGIVLWNMISSSIIMASSVFFNNSTVIKNIKTPSLRISLQLMLQQFINLLHNLVVVVFIFILYPHTINASLWLLSLPGLALVMINLLWIIQVAGILGARFRDFDPLIGALMPILFFLSPVIYRSQQLGTMAVVMRFNPFAYFIDIVRDPLLGSVPPLHEYGAIIVMACVGWALALWLTRTKAQRLAYWV